MNSPCDDGVPRKAQEQLWRLGDYEYLMRYLCSIRIKVQNLLLSYLVYGTAVLPQQGCPMLQPKPVPGKYGASIDTLGIYRAI